jgi:type IV secretory pathway VirB10-like protein
MTESTEPKKPNYKILFGGAGALVAILAGILYLRAARKPNIPRNKDEAAVAAVGLKERLRAEAAAAQVRPTELGQGLKFDAQGNLLGAPSAAGSLPENKTLDQLGPKGAGPRPADSINASLDMSADETTRSFRSEARASRDPAAAEQARVDRKEERDLNSGSMLGYSTVSNPRWPTKLGEGSPTQGSIRKASNVPPPETGVVPPEAGRGSGTPDSATTMVQLLQQAQAAGALGQGPAPAAPGASQRPLKSLPGQMADMRTGGGPAFVIREGQFLDVVLVNNVEASFNETPVIGIVNRDFLSPDGKVVLVPHGTQVLGVAGKVENQAQARLFMGFHRALFPNGKSAFFPEHQLPVGMAADGSYGVDGKVNRHFWLQFGGAIVMGLVDGLAAAAAGPTEVNTNSGFAQVTPGQLLVGRTGNALNSVVAEMVRKYSNILPTVSLKAGKRLKLYFTEDCMVNAQGSSSDLSWVQGGGHGR